MSEIDCIAEITEVYARYRLGGGRLENGTLKDLKETIEAVSDDSPTSIPLMVNKILEHVNEAISLHYSKHGSFIQKTSIGGARER